MASGPPSVADGSKISEKSLCDQDGGSEVKGDVPESDATASPVSLSVVAEVACCLERSLNLGDLASAAIASSDAAREEAVNTIDDVLSDLAGAENTSEPEQVAPTTKDCDSIPEPSCSLQLSETQSQSVDGTEPVTQVEDVPLQLLLEDERKAKKLLVFERKKAIRRGKASHVPESGDLVEPTAGHVAGAEEDVACDRDSTFVPAKKKIKRAIIKKHFLGDVTPRRSPRVCKVAGSSVGELPEVDGQAAGGTPSRSPRVLGYAKPTTSPLGPVASGKGKKCGIKRKGGPTKVNKGCKKRSRVNADDQDDVAFDADDEDADDVADQYEFVKRPVRRKRGGKPEEGAVEGEDDAKRFNKMVRCSLKELKVCAKLLEPRHIERVVKSGFGAVFDWKVDSNISRPLMGHIYTKIDPSTMILDMGHPNKVIRITSDAVHLLFGLPQGDHTPPRPSEDGYDDAVMRLKAKLGYQRSDDIKTKDLRKILEDLVKDDTKDDLALQVFYLIVFMKVVIPGTSTRVSREAAMAENLVLEDMADMDYCQLLVDDLQRAVIRYRQGTSRGKAVTGCGIAPLLMYLDCLILGKKAVVDLRTPRISFMDQAKLCELASADLIKKGDDDPANWVYGKLPWKTQAEVVFFRHIERPVLTIPRATAFGSEAAPRIECSQDVNTCAPPEVAGGSSADRNAAGGIPSESTKGVFDAASVSLSRIDGLLSAVCGEIACVPTTVERLSCVDGILPPGHGFDAESSKEALTMEAKILSEIRQSTVHLRTCFGMFREMQDARCKPFEVEASVVITQMERHDSVELGRDGGSEAHADEAAVDGHTHDDTLPESGTLPVRESPPRSDFIAAGVDGNVSKFDGVNVDSEILPNKDVSGIGCSDDLDQTEERSPIGDGGFDAKEGKSVGGVTDMFSNNTGCTAPTSVSIGSVTMLNASSTDKASMEPVVETVSAHAGPAKSPAAQPTVVVVADSPAPPTTRAPVSAPSAGVPEEQNVISTGDGDDAETKSDGGEQDLSSSTPALGKNT